MTANLEREIEIPSTLYRKAEPHDYMEKLRHKGFVALKGEVQSKLFSN
jgi:hypothetical protein